MSLKDLTKAKHTEAEHTPFMKAIFNGQMPEPIWADYTYNKMLWYGAIEAKAISEGLLDDMPEIARAYYLWQDANEMLPNGFPRFKQAAIDYQNYIFHLPAGKVVAHLYTWHMGDLFGGQMIKKMLPGPHRNLEFTNADALKAAMYSKLDDSLAEEANIAFNWAIRIMNAYNDRFDN